MKVSELPPPKKREWNEFLERYAKGEYDQHDRWFLHEYSSARFGLTLHRDHFTRLLRTARC